MRIPVIPTIVVLVACGIMVWLGVWQLGRADEKAELIARYEAAVSTPTPLETFPFEPADSLFRRVEYPCLEVTGWKAIAGRNSFGQSGYAHVAQCEGPYAMPRQGGVGEVVVGWSRTPVAPDWSGGKVGGIIARGGKYGWRVVATDPVNGLEANATPDPNDLPNNHLSYAVQWFLFALTALVIYILALRRRGR